MAVPAPAARGPGLDRLRETPGQTWVSPAGLAAPQGLCRLRPQTGPPGVPLAHQQVAKGCARASRCPVPCECSACSGLRAARRAAPVSSRRGSWRPAELCTPGAAGLHRRARCSSRSHPPEGGDLTVRLCVQWRKSKSPHGSGNPGRSPSAMSPALLIFILRQGLAKLPRWDLNL